MEFVEIRGFPGYSVNIWGEVRNDATRRILVQTVNNRGLAQVGMMRDGVQHKRGIALMVAETFLKPPYPETFDTPIHLDGNKLNNHVENLMWRPRWFAVKYAQQFRHYEVHGPYIPVKIIEVHSKLKFKNSWDAATTFGLIDREIYVNTMNRHYVWPTYQEFRVYNERRTTDRIRQL